MIPPGKRMKDESLLQNIWDRRFQEPLRQLHAEQMKAKVEHYTEQGNALDEAISRAANDL